MEYENRYTETRKHTHTTTKKNKKRKKGTQQKALLDNNNDGYKLEETMPLCYSFDLVGVGRNL